MLLPLLALLPWATYAQTDYSGIYYIGSTGWVQANTTTNYYLCPTENWLYYDATTGFTDAGNGQPFMTTYQCRNGVYDASEAIWIVTKHPTQEYYYIRRAVDGKYLTYNSSMPSGNDGRVRVHLETTDQTNSNTLFTITYVSNSYYNIQPKNAPGNKVYMNVTDGNKLSLQASGKTDGPGNRAMGGTIGLWTSGSENTSKWYLEPATALTPTIVNNYDGTVTIASTTTGATIYYTLDDSDPTTSTTTYATTPATVTLANDTRTIKAIAYRSGDYMASLPTSYDLSQCDEPVITVSGGMVSFTCSTAGVTFHYTLDGTTATHSSTEYLGPFSLGSATTVKVIAVKSGCIDSYEGYYSAVPIVAQTVNSSSEITDMYGSYILAENFTSTASIGTAAEPFRGTIDGQMHPISGLNHALVDHALGATIKNVILDDVAISSGTNVGAICNEALGNTRIYNCGILATGSTLDGDGNIATCSSTVGGSGKVGGIVGLLDDNARVVNCFSYANITSGSYVGGIVGYNNVSTTSANLKTMVMNCMFYGDITGGSFKAPIYNGYIITNDGDDNGINNYNYFRAEATYVRDHHIDFYNCALAAETRFLQRFEFFRHLLNSNRALAAWWATGDRDNTAEMMKWVLEPDQIGTTTPFPILKLQGKHHSVVNYQPSNVAIDGDNVHLNEGRKLTGMGDNGILTVNIQMGDGEVYNHPSSASIDITSLELTITDKDPAHYNFNYGKVQLPYYNDVGTLNYTGNRVVTGWKIVDITSGTKGSYTTGDEITYDGSGNIATTPYNFADRTTWAKDFYGTGGSNRIFNQGAYWDVPDGVTEITIEPYWAQCVYVADEYLDVVYQNGTGTNANDAMYTAVGVSTVGGGQRYVDGNSYSINNDNQAVYTSISTAVTALFNNITEATSADHSVYDYAIVLIGNTHNTGVSSNSAKRPFTIMSADLDGDNEPDNTYILRFDTRTKSHPVRVDFIDLMGLGMAQKTTGSTGSFNFGILQPLSWFESTNTSLFWVTQFEYSILSVAAPTILQGGVVEQWVSGHDDKSVTNKNTYYLVGGNVWFKEFHRGTHQDKTFTSKHPPVSVTGGDFNEFYLTGLYRGDVSSYNDNAECYIDGGRFGIVAGAGMEGIGNASTHANGNITWLIDHADMDEFYGGGINAANIVEGNISTTIDNSRVGIFCGGPKFGDMNDDRIVTTTATECTFGTFFGAGYGGNSYNRRAPYNKTDKINIDWNAWVNEEYTQKYDSGFDGVETQIDYQFIPMSNNLSNVCRLWIEYVKFSLATTKEVVSTLNECTVTGNFYGGGSLGKVVGDVTSTLTDCTVLGSVFGSGFSATLPEVPVMNLGGFLTEPEYDEDLGTFLEAEFPDTVYYHWVHSDEVNSTETAIDATNAILYTEEDLNTLGSVNGNVSLTIDGNSSVGVNVFGGGEESAVTGDITVLLKGNTTVTGNVYGGGDRGAVTGDTQVLLKD